MVTSCDISINERNLFSASSFLLSQSQQHSGCPPPTFMNIADHFVITSSGFTSRVVKSFTQSMKQFSVTLLYVPRNSLNCQGNDKTTLNWSRNQQSSNESYVQYRVMYCREGDILDKCLCLPRLFSSSYFGILLNCYSTTNMTSIMCWIVHYLIIINNKQCHTRTHLFDLIRFGHLDRHEWTELAGSETPDHFQTRDPRASS